MRKWYKFDVSAKNTATVLVHRDRKTSDMQKSVVDFDMEAYQSKEAFFKKYLFGCDSGRFEYYHEFLEKYLPKDGEVFSVGSGRCANELYLGEHGYTVKCSDLDYPTGYYETTKIFPKFRFTKLNCLDRSPPGFYDSIIALGLIYLFNEEELVRFFRLVSIGLKRNGVLILDAGGPPDNFLSHFVNDILLWHEAMFKRMVKTVMHKRSYGLIVRDFGYRRTDQEIINAALKAELTLVEKDESAYLTEFARSELLKSMMVGSMFLEKFFLKLGRRIPHIRLFKFEKKTLL